MAIIKEISKWRNLIIGNLNIDKHYVNVTLVFTLLSLIESNKFLIKRLITNSLHPDSSSQL